MSYFRPLRRKLGVVTLVMACVLAVGWVRTIATTGEQLPIGKSLILTSAHAELSIRYGRDVVNKLLADRADDGSPVLVEKGSGTHWEDLIRIPYWRIVLPLIFLSAWLLLSTPRAKSGPTQN